MGDRRPVQEDVDGPAALLAHRVPTKSGEAPRRAHRKATLRIRLRSGIAPPPCNTLTSPFQAKIRTELLTQFKDELDTTRQELEQKYKYAIYSFGHDLLVDRLISNTAEPNFKTRTQIIKPAVMQELFQGHVENRNGQGDREA